MAEDGSFVIIWIADRADGATDVHALRFRADGSAVDTPPRAPPPWLLTPGEFRLNATGVGRNLDPAVAMARDGRFVVCWSNLADGNTLALRRFDADGTPAAGIETFVQGLSNDNTLSHGRLAWDPNPDKLEARDRIALSFLEPLGSRRHLVFVGLDSRLRPLNAQVALSPENGGELIEGNLAINHAGQVVLAGICTQPGGRSVLVGQGLLFDPMSAPVATRLENTDMSPPFLYGGECGLDLALGCDERIVLTWQANDIGNPGASSVFLREMTPDLGVVTPAPLRAPETLTGSQRAPSIALWAGSGALVWSGHGERPGQSDPAGNFVRGLLLGAPDKPVAEHAVAISPFDAAGRGSEPSPAVDAARSNDLEEVGA
ncbi:MAG: hypothetical protein R3E83_02795 [Burkholderiaceae bacterium]